MLFYASEGSIYFLEMVNFVETLDLCFKNNYNQNS